MHVAVVLLAMATTLKLTKTCNPPRAAHPLQALAHFVKAQWPLARIFGHTLRDEILQLLVVALGITLVVSESLNNNQVTIFILIFLYQKCPS